MTKGQKVRAGEKLISFDLDGLAQAARSLITPIVVTNGENFVIEQRLVNSGVACGQKLMTLRRLTPLSAPATHVAHEVRRELIVPLAHGLHARPAARLANLAKSFAAEIAILSGEKRVNAAQPGRPDGPWSFPRRTGDGSCQR